jgi:hypothetical protein
VMRTPSSPAEAERASSGYGVMRNRRLADAGCSIRRAAAAPIPRGNLKG